jgi:hypothetical protein
MAIKFKKVNKGFLLLLSALLVFLLIIDFRGPSTIPLKKSVAFGFPCLRARDLVVQEYDKDGNLWATRGMIIYELKKSDDKFTRVAHIPTGFTILWLRNFSIIRKLTIRPECVEMTKSVKGICALSGGKMWFLDRDKKRFLKTMQLSNYGMGDQGIRNDGILNFKDSLILIGEYFRNSERQSVKIFKTNPDFHSWQTAREFVPGAIRHIHSIQADPFTRKLWICTGDNDKESFIGYSDGLSDSIMPIGKGNQTWRSCQLVFTKEAVYWGTDTGSEEYAGIYRWDRETSNFEKLGKIEGASFYATRLSKGTIVMSTDREGLPNERNSKTQLIFLTDGNKITCFDGGTWKHKKKGFWFKYALLRFQRYEGSPSLAITCLNQKELPDSELVIISEDDILSAVRTMQTIN